MRAAWYDRFGEAHDVLTVGDMPTPDPGPGEVRVALRASGINPSDVKLRAGARPGAVIEHPRIIPHSDGAGVIDQVGPGVDPGRVGQRVWVWNAGWQRAFGTAAEFVTLPAHQAVPLPKGTGFAEGACLGIPAMTAWYALFGDGAAIEDTTVLITGGAGAVGRYACQMAALAGARVITTVSSSEKAAHAGAAHWVNYREGEVVQEVMELTGGQGVDRIVEVDFGANQAASVALIKPGGVIAAYASAAAMSPELAFYPLMFRNVTLRMLIVYQFDGPLRRRAEAELTAWLAAGDLSHAVVSAGGLQDIAAAHDQVARGEKLGTVVIEI